ncbi:MAG TPA: hypothetical protein VF449_07525 [Parvibaculum sp.]
MKKLPIIRSFHEVYAGVFTHFWDLVRVAWLPLIFLISSRIAMALWIAPALNRLSSYSSTEAKQAVATQIGGAAFFVGLSLLLCTPMMAVGFHRFVLLGEKARGLLRTGFGIGRRELLYLWASLLVGIALMMPVIITGLITGTAAAALIPVDGAGKDDVLAHVALAAFPLTAMLLVGGLFWGKWMLVLPHVALGNSSSLRFVWEQTRGNSWRLLFYSVLVYLPVGLMLGASQVIQAMSPAAGILFDTPIFVLTAMLTITYLSVAYREIIGLPAAAAPEAAEPA